MKKVIMDKQLPSKPELLIGAGSFASAKAAVKNRADAIYFGIKGYNMRDLGTNFEESEMKELMDYLHENKVKGYMALNTTIFEDELKAVEGILKKAKKAGVDAVIVYDLGIMALAKEIGVEIHLSTQASVANVASLKQYKALGVQRIVLARELGLEQIKKIHETAKEIGVEIECFIHGARCIAISGSCFMSHELFGKSANRGECLQVCRRVFFEDGHGKNVHKKELEIDGDTILSAKDLKTIDFLDKIIYAGAVSLKVEGRNRPTDYVSTVTKCYREAIDSIYEGTYTKEKITAWDSELKKVYNRGFSKGFYLGKAGKRDVANAEGSLQTQHRKITGKVVNYYPKPMVAEIKLINDLKTGDKIIIEGKTTFIEQQIDSMEIHNKKVDSAKKGMRVAIKINDKARENDKVFVLEMKSQIVLQEK